MKILCPWIVANLAEESIDNTKNHRCWKARMLRTEVGGEQKFPTLVSSGTGCSLMGMGSLMIVNWTTCAYKHLSRICLWMIDEYIH
jgi:hypothetical protein